MASDTAHRIEAQASGAARTGRSRLARIGLFGKGMLYTSTGLLAVDVAIGRGGDASSDGAVENVAAAPFGRLLLVIMTVSLLALVVWKALQAIVGDPVEGSETIDRVRNGAKAVLYGGSAVTALTILIAQWDASPGGDAGGSGSSSGGGEGETSEQTAGVVLGWPGGRWLVALAGIAVIGYGLYEAWKHVVDAQFMERLRFPDPGSEEAMKPAGRVGYAAKSASIVGIGVFLVAAGIRSDEDEATGLSGLLRELAARPWGAAALWALAIGLVVFGLFTFAEARYRRAT